MGGIAGMPALSFRVCPIRNGFGWLIARGSGCQFVMRMGGTVQLRNLADQFLKLVLPDLQALPHADRVLHVKQLVQLVDKILLPQQPSPSMRTP